MDSILTFQRWTCNSDTMLNFDSTSNICCADNCYKCIYFLGPPVSIDIRMQTFSLGIYFKLFKRTNLGPTIGSTLAQKKKKNLESLSFKNWKVNICGISIQKYQFYEV